MVDTRFFSFQGPMGLGALLQAAGHHESPLRDVEITGADELEAAGPGEVSFASSEKYADAMRISRASVILTTPGLAGQVPAAALAVVTDDPHLLFVKVLQQLYPASGHRLAISPQGPESDQARFEENVTIGAGSVIGSGAEIGRDTVIGPNSVIGPGVAIGRGCVIGAGVTIECSYLGDNVTIHSGARVGAQGFGWLDHGKSNIYIPQLGRAIVQTGAEVGPNSVVDRGALGDTVIGEGTKLGALVEIGHNSRIGRNCLLAPTTGLSGGTIVGDGVLMGAGVGTAGHLTIGSGSIVYARSAVTKDWPENARLGGAPAQDIKDFWRELAVLRKLSRNKGDKA